MEQKRQAPRVLIVDDAPAVGDVFGMKLEREGYVAVIAQNTERAHRLLEAEEFDVILLDIRLPDGSGLELLKRLRQQRSLLDTPIIVISGLDQTSDVVDALREGANDYITKPFDLAVAFARVRTQVAVKRLKEANDRFLHIAGNDLKKPLMSLLDAARQLYTEHQPGSTVTAQDHKTFASIIESAEHMREVITDVLELRALRDRRLRVEKLETDLGAIVRQAVAHSSVLAKIKGIELRMEFERELPNIYADDARIMQVLENLISNAIKFSPANTATAIRTKRDQDWVLCEVADKGPGVPEQEVKLLYTDNVQISNSSTTGVNSTGMGLALVREIVLLHDGEVGMRNDAGGGATFWFRLPMVESVYLS
ncbi:MAG: hybrid sensor histidine kinase/response regulator [Gammaproteobacteria bacterium]|nr:hybrid sensor histidine kinase/response regulator [Gammaproteobacteria bacterium]